MKCLAVWSVSYCTYWVGGEGAITLQQTANLSRIDASCGLYNEAVLIRHVVLSRSLATRIYRTD